MIDTGPRDLTTSTPTRNRGREAQDEQAAMNQAYAAKRMGEDLELS